MGENYRVKLLELPCFGLCAHRVSYVTYVNGIYLSQRKYTLTLLEGTDFISSKPALLRMDPSVKLGNIEGDLLPDWEVVILDNLNT